MENQKFRAQVIIEILGRPPEHIKFGLSELIVRLGAEKGIKIISKTIHEPKLVENSQGLFTSFADILLEMDSLDNYFGIIFGYMPSHIELIEPERISVNNFELNELANKLISRLHSYDAIVKKTVVDRNFLLQKLKELAPQFFKAFEKEEAKTLEQSIARTNPPQKKAKSKKATKKSKKK